MMREYIVTCKSYEELDSLYDDLETPGGTEYVPDREVECANKRLISRNTHYKLTDEEAELLLNDERVISVELTPEERGVIFRPNYNISTQGWSKSATNNETYRNWGFYRCVNGATVANWGSDGSIPNTFGTSQTVQVTSSGKNVDFVIVDGCFDPAHPEFAVNENGTGGSRVIQYNWLQHRPEVEGTAAGTYVYTPYTTGSAIQQIDNNHGCHVAGTAAGNRRGWARDANIYNINLYSSAATNLGAYLIFDYIRAWHNSKPVNPTTGRKNPTITNNSWGSVLAPISFTNIEWINYRGTQINTPGGGWTKAILESYGVLCNATLSQTQEIPFFSAALQADIDDSIADGIIIVAAAGNDSFKSDAFGGSDYNNQIKEAGFLADYYHRGSQPAQLTGVISVGDLDATVTEQKSISSTTGPRIDIHAPGTNITSSVHSNGGGVSDSRNNAYRIIKYNGTSMASPQVSGVLACLLEQWPRMTQAEALEYIKNYGRTINQIVDPGATTRTWNVTASGNADYVFSGFSSGNDIGITATEGTILTFNVNAPGHPFWIKRTQTTGAGITNYSGSGASPSTILLQNGNLNIEGTVVSGNADYVTFTVGSTPINALYLTSYVGVDEVAFFAIQQGSSWTAGVDTSQMIAWSHFGPGVPGYDLYDNVLAGQGATLLANTTYTMWIQQTGASSTGYAFSTNQTFKALAETISNNGDQTGTVTWNTRGITPGTYYYICEYHGAMTGTITITQDYLTTRSLQGSSNRYLYYTRERRVPNPAGATYIGGATTSQITEPRNQYKRRSTSGMVYPRPHIWHRKLT